MLIISTTWFNNESMTHVTESSSRNLGLFNVSITSSLNPFQATGIFLYHLKTSQKLRHTDVFRGYRKSAWNGFINAVAHERERKDLLPFNLCLATPRPTLGHYRGDSLTHSLLITAFLQIWPEGHREPRSEVGSLSPAELPVFFFLTFFTVDLQHS